PTLLTTDSNLHSVLWNPDHDTSQDPNADHLVEVMTNWGLFLHSLKGIPMFGMDRSNTLGTSVDLIWVNENADDIVMACLIDTNDEFNHNSDHQALITILSCP
ncbi:hypothetical protein CROQUDRAFT_14147, partial [Cronartium quercuum f. sp. fusiforme G11]